MSTRPFRALVLLVCIASVLHAQDGPSFVGPRVVKLDHGTHALRAADLNHDGRTDLAIANNPKARIDLLIQRAPGRRSTPRSPSGTCPATTRCSRSGAS